jgi:hypothetical protein
MITQGVAASHTVRTRTLRHGPDFARFIAGICPTCTCLTFVIHISRRPTNWPVLLVCTESTTGV